MQLDQLTTLPAVECLLAPPPGAVMGTAFTSDLLSDVMAHAEESSLLITIQAHTNTVAVATLLGLPGILICSSRPIPEDMLSAARKESIALYRTSLDQFRASIAVHDLLLAAATSTGEGAVP